MEQNRSSLYCRHIWGQKCGHGFQSLLVGCTATIATTAISSSNRKGCNSSVSIPIGTITLLPLLLCSTKLKPQGCPFVETE